MKAVKGSYRDFFYNNFDGQKARQIEDKIQLHQRYHSIAKFVWKGTSDEVYRGCTRALQEWIENGDWQKLLPNHCASAETAFEADPSLQCLSKFLEENTIAGFKLKDLVSFPELCKDTSCSPGSHPRI